MAEKTTQQNLKINTSKFSGLAFVGIKKIEYFPKAEEESVLLEDLTDLLENRNYNNNLMIGFFSVKSFGSEKVDQLDSLFAFNEEANENLLRHSLKKVALFDFAECEETLVGQLHILIAADCIMYWNNKGSYIQPTQENSLGLDLEDIIKSFKEKQEVVIYSNKDLSKFANLKFTQKSLAELPITQNMWVNQPSFQETYGNMTLFIGLALLGICYGLIHWQNSNIRSLNVGISSNKSQILNSDFYKSSNREYISFLDSVNAKNIKPLVLKDISYSLNKVGFKLESLELKNSEIKGVLEAVITSKKNEHTLFSEQEPLAQNIIDNSFSIIAIKKQTSEQQQLILEALIDIDKFKEQLASLKKGN